MNHEWISKRWFEFRIGYSTYLVFIFGFSNFMLLMYNLFPGMKDLIEFHVFGIIVFFIILPACIVMGNIHNKRQFRTESKVTADNAYFKDKIQPDSKEVFATKYNVFSIEYSKWTNQMSLWQLTIAEKNMEIMNLLVERLGGNVNLKFDERQTLDEFKNRLVKWNQELEAWKNKYEILLSGGEASKL